MRTDTLSIMFIDVKGYTEATSKQTHKQNAGMLEQVRKLVEPVVRAHDGWIIKTLGDGYMLAFQSPSDAIGCARVIQHRVKQPPSRGRFRRNLPADEHAELALKVALSTGEVRIDRKDVFGDPVNLAARLEGQTPAGEIYLTQSAYLCMNRSGIPLEKVGPMSFKGIEDDILVYRVHDVEPAFTARLTPALMTPWENWMRKLPLLGWGVGLAVLLISGAIRFWPADSYQPIVAAVESATANNDAEAILRAAKQLPSFASQARAQIRPNRRHAVRLLIDARKLPLATIEIERLLQEDAEDAETIVLQAELMLLRDRLKASLQLVETSLKLDQNLGSQDTIHRIILQGMQRSTTRDTTQSLVSKYLGKKIVPAFSDALAQKLVGDRVSRQAIAKVLSEQGAADHVDWTSLYLDDLASSNCKLRKSALASLYGKKTDPRIIQPIAELAGSKNCAAPQAQALLKELSVK